MTSRNLLRRPLLAGALLCATIVATVSEAYADWRPTLIGFDEPAFAPDADLKISLSSEIPEETIAWLALELDGIDVSEIVRLEQGVDGLVAAVTPPQALAAGSHELRLVEYSPAGDVIERGIWRFDVLAGGDDLPTGESEAIKRFFAAQVSLEGSYRVADGDLDTPLDKAIGQGAASFEYESSRGSWQTSARANLVYDSRGAGGAFGDDDNGQAVSPFDGSELELGEYLVSARSNNVAALIGHHGPVQESLLIQDFHRRGASITANTDGGSLTGSAFAYRTEPVAGFRYGFGVGDHGHRVVGSLISLKPADDGDLLTITGTWIRGEGEDRSGLGVAGEDLLPQGDGYSLAVESLLADRRVQLRAEQARTSYDFDGDQPDFEKTDDEAESFLGLFHVFTDKPIGSNRATWSVGYERKKTGLYFRSLANPSLPYDRSIDRVFTVYRAGGLSVQVQAAEETDNVDNDPRLPTLHNTLGSLSVTWTPRARVDEEGNRVSRWFGQPSFHFSAESSDQQHEDVPAELEDFALDRQVTTYQGGVVFQYTDWNWSLNHSLAFEEDDTARFDRRHELTDLRLQMRVGSKLLLGTQAQYNTIVDRGTRELSRSWLAGLDAQASLLDDRLLATLNYSVNRDAAGDDSWESETRTYGLRLDWILRRPAANLPGWSIWVQGEMQETEVSDDAFDDVSPYQVFVGARMDWPVNWISQ